MDFQVEPNNFIDPLWFSVRRKTSGEKIMSESGYRKFSDDLDKIKSLLDQTKALDSSESIRIISYYLALYQCVEFVRFDKSKIIRMKLNFQDMSKLICVSLDRLGNRVRTTEINEIRGITDELIKYLSEMFIRSGMINAE